ncbi:uncharacterized protein J3R85_006121 [Psidium guajava]|nr:uncharacterized protein J3R85_006121 [Psidium guajava]
MSAPGPSSQPAPIQVNRAVHGARAFDFFRSFECRWGIQANRCRSLRLGFLDDPKPPTGQIKMILGRYVLKLPLILMVEFKTIPKEVINPRGLSCRRLTAIMSDPRLDFIIWLTILDRLQARGRATQWKSSGGHLCFMWFGS